MGFFSEIVRLYQKQRLKFGSEATKIRILRQWGVQIGEHCRIHTLNWPSEPWLVRIGNHVTIPPDVTFVTHNSNTLFQEKYESLTGFGPIDIKDYVQIGINTTILPNVTIGPWSVIGAGSVVTKDVPPNTVVAGNPAKPICTIDEFERKCVEGHIDVPLDRDELRRFLVQRFFGGGAGP